MTHTLKHLINYRYVAVMEWADFVPFIFREWTNTSSESFAVKMYIPGVSEQSADKSNKTTFRRSFRGRAGAYLTYVLIMSSFNILSCTVYNGICFFQLKKMLIQLTCLLHSQNTLRNKEMEMRLKQQSSKIATLKRKVCQLESTVGKNMFIREK